MRSGIVQLPILTLLLVLLTAGTGECGKREHLVYFQNTPYELNVYKIFGRKDGPTIMIVGGIQGDEPGGFLSADLYTDLALKQGNLIVVPRANFNSILLFKRGPNGDMNRKFGYMDKNDPESKIVHVLKSLIAESDLLLNLHDGWGYYRPVYESNLANPMRYGQSIIADADVYVCPKTGRTLHLKDIAGKVISRINDQIDNSKYHFHFMNTRTSAKDSPYSEQKTSATYYALTRHAIPAFGVETSKNLPSIEMKVHQHNLAINAFMETFGLEPEQPRIYLEKPKLKYMVISVNNQIPVAIPDGETLFVNPDDTVEVIHVEANYDRGLSVDIQGMGTINDFHRPFKVQKPTFIVAQKDHIKFGRVGLALGKAPVQTIRKPVQTASTQETIPDEPEDKTFRVEYFIVDVNGKKTNVADGGSLNVKNGDLLKVVDVKAQGVLPEGAVVNFKGFVGQKRGNTGEDRGYTVDTSRDLMARYSLSEKQRIYEVVVEQQKTVLARMTIHID